MSKYTEKAAAYRANPEAMGKVHYNCAQAVVTAFAEDLHYDEEAAYRTSAAFGGGDRRCVSVRRHPRRALHRDRTAHNGRLSVQA